MPSTTEVSTINDLPVEKRYKWIEYYWREKSQQFDKYFLTVNPDASTRSTMDTVPSKMSGEQFKIPVIQPH